MSAKYKIGHLIHLTPWREVVGTYHGFHVDGGCIVARVEKIAKIFWIEKETNPPKGGQEECHPDVRNV